MPSVCFYFQVHQPYRLKRYSFFNIGRDHDYFDEEKNKDVFRKVARKCYLPTNRVLQRLIDKHAGKFRVAFSISGMALEQMKKYDPEVLESFQRLAKTGCVEFLAETYYHTLASVFDEDEFREQVRLHQACIFELFGQKPTVFRNTELVYNDRLSTVVREMGFQGVLAEGADDVLGWRSPNYIYEAAGPGATGLKLLLKNYRLSDDIAFRFSNKAWEGWPLTASKFAMWVHRALGDGANGDVTNLFLDYETFGEHQWEATGIFDFLAQLPEELLKAPEWSFLTPSQVVAQVQAVGELSFPRTVSWADTDRDLSAWKGNHMQEGAFRQVYELASAVRMRNNPATTDLWRKLQTSDHFYYMSTKWFADGDVHAYFSPYKSPYEAFITYMNVLTDFRQSVLNLKDYEEATA